MIRILAIGAGLAFCAAPAWAGVPDSLTVQGRATAPLTTINGTATVLPDGFSQAFTAATDANGVFQFTLTGLSANKFTDPNSSLQLQIGTTTISIPFNTVPFAFRAAQTDTLISGATIQINRVDVATLTAANILASSATFTGDVFALSGISVGSGTIRIDVAGAGAPNTITFTSGNGIIETAPPAPGSLILQTAGANPINLNPGGPGLVSLGGNMELLANQRIFRSVGGVLRVESDVANALRLNAANAGNVLVAEGGGNVGVGMALPAARLDVLGNLKIVDGTQAAGRVLTSDANGLASWQTPAAAPDADWTIAGSNMFSNVPGNVGIGTGTPSFALHVASAAGFAGDILVVSTGASDMFRVNGLGEVRAARYFGDGSALTGIMAAVGAASAVSSSTDVVITADSDANGTGNIFLLTGANNRLAVLNNGNVGIGTTIPGARLQVVGTSNGDGILVTGPAPSVNISSSTGVNNVLGVASVAGQFSSDSVPGDLVLRAGSTGIITNLILQTGAGASHLKIGKDGRILVNTGITEARLTVSETAPTAPVMSLNKRAGQIGVGPNLVLDNERVASSEYIFLLARSDKNGVIDTKFNLRGDGNGFADGAWNGGGADYAEWLEVEGTISERDVVGISRTTGKAKKYEAGDLLFGVAVSTASSAFVAGRPASCSFSSETCFGYRPVAIAGQVDVDPVQVTETARLVTTVIEDKRLGFRLSNGKLLLAPDRQ